MPATKEWSAHFKTVQKLSLDYAPITITQYESTRTGMRIAVIDQKGPKVNGYFALATEIDDDSGAPHTLEHLCFMGSKSYHYKGFLDKLATRQYSMTNAWTATDQTAYTLDSAGWEAFANMLPVYLDHLIVPTLTDSACYTEVWHIDGTGHDAGVVYSEMQGVQNLAEERMDLALRRLMYPEGNGFRYETGGMMEALRVLKADRIREFHKEMYQPKNMRLVITGEVDHNELLQIVDNFEDTVLDQVPPIDAPFKRPWVESKATPKLEKSILEKVLFPEEDESMGEIFVGFFGPLYSDSLANDALSVLLHYLTGSSIAILENVLVEKEQLCSEVRSQIDFRPDAWVCFGLSAVETGKLELVEARFIELLKETANNDFDMAYMHDCLVRLRRKIISKGENAGSFFSDSVISDHLFGRRSGEDLEPISTMNAYDELMKWSEHQWRDFMKKWLSDAHHVSVLGIPSQELSAKMMAEEEERVKTQQMMLGEDGMKKLAEKLKKAQDDNNRPIPDGLLEKFPIPSTDSIHFITTVTARSGAARRTGRLDNDIQKIVDEDDDGLPLFIHFEHIPSKFVRIRLILCTSSVPVDLKPLLTLYIMNFFTTPVVRNGERMEFEDVVLELERQTVAYSADPLHANPELLSIMFETEPERYSAIIGWLRAMLFDAIHDPERLYASLTKILADVPDEKRDGSGMATSVMTMIQNDHSSALRAQDTLSKSLYLRRMRKLLKDDPDAVIAKFTQLCQTLHKPENFRIYVAANVEMLPQPVTAWKTLTDGLDMSKPLQALDDRKACLSNIGRNPGNTAFIVPIAATDSSFVLVSAKGPDSYDHPDLPALMVAATYLDAVEGPLWATVRGTGLAYGTNWMVAPGLGILKFRIYRSPNAYKAWTVCKDQIERIACGAIPFDKLMLEGAISEIVLNMANDQPTMSTAAANSFTNQVIFGIDKEWNHEMLAKVRAVAPELVREAMTKYMVPAFKPESCNMIVTCAQIMAQSLEAEFKGDGFAAEIRPLDSFQDDYGLKVPEGREKMGDDDEDEDESDEDEDESDEDEDESDEDEDEPVDTPSSEECSGA
ncbi:MAG: hypothetical protein FE78DRAFT_72345 [Acidomyces sp. 'richmondensis']|nr:MAG: hypothetical protein FE78DRAFT_72345 [Acidomyces sp. 'richmondensis']